MIKSAKQDKTCFPKSVSSNQTRNLS